MFKCPNARCDSRSRMLTKRGLFRHLDMSPQCRHFTSNHVLSKNFIPNAFEVAYVAACLDTRSPYSLQNRGDDIYESESDHYNADNIVEFGESLLVVDPNTDVDTLSNGPSDINVPKVIMPSAGIWYTLPTEDL